MTIRPYLVLAFTVAVIACAASDDPDNGFPSPTPTLSPTPTGSPTGPTPTPTPIPGASPITQLASFISAGGGEVWLCLRSQFAGTITNIAVGPPGQATCAQVKLGVGLTSTTDRAHYHAVRMDTGVTCNTAAHHWNIDYLVDGDRCTGCVNQVYNFDFPAADAFGTFCGGTGTGPAPIDTMTSYLATTTQKIRLTADIASVYALVAITNVRIYTAADAFLTDCTTTATIVNGGDGIFDVDCTPAVTLVPTTTYHSVITMMVDGVEYIGSENFVHGVSP